MISQKTRQSLLVGIATVTIVLGTILTVLLAQGYRINPTSGAIYTTGLVIADSRPSGARVFLNDTNTRTNTPARFESIEPGPLNIKLTKQGYRDWSTTKQVRAYEVIYADYALLIPQAIPFVRLNPAVSFSSSTQAEDRRNIYGVSKQNPSIWRVRNDLMEQIYSPTTTAPAQAKLDSLTSSITGDRLLLRQATAESTNPSLMYLDTNSKAITNLSSKFGPSLQDVRFSPSSADQLFWLDATNLRRITMPAQTASDVLAKNVVSYTLSKTNIITIERESSGGLSEDNIYRYDLDGNNRHLVYNLHLSSDNYQLGYSKGQFNDYLFVLNRPTSQLTVLRDPFSNTQLATTVKNVTGFSFNTSGRFLVVGDSRGGMRSYDLEFTSATRSAVNLPTNPNTWLWYGEYQIIFVQDGKVYIVDYDGKNLQQLSNDSQKVISSYPYLSGKGFYELKDDGQFGFGKFELKN